MAQFVGLRVSVALHNSETLVGTLSSIDAVSGTVRLALSGQGGGKERVIKREEMKGLNVLDNAGGSGNGNAGPVTAASVGLSPSNTQQGIQTSPRPAQHLTPSPSPPTTGIKRSERREKEGGQVAVGEKSQVVKRRTKARDRLRATDGKTGWQPWEGLRRRERFSRPKPTLAIRALIEEIVEINDYQRVHKPGKTKMFQTVMLKTLISRAD
ncbi:hypothetical protein BT69DRAFT_217405 [Atractiella rhizophila]|nr:hypothetical protein BT69DRAFT_217405 [Atractiella rhizophila]